MPWCPKCKTEFREGFKSCSSCGTKLVDELEPGGKKLLGKRSPGKVKWAFLMNVLDEYEMNIVRSILESHDIPVYIKHKEAGQYLSIIMGVSKYGIDLFVPEDKLEQAGEILSALEENPEEGLNEDEDLNENLNEDLKED